VPEVIHDGRTGFIVESVDEAVQAVAKENGYGYVFEKEALLVAPPGDDILPLVAKRLNIKLPAPGTTSPAAPKPSVKQ